MNARELFDLAPLGALVRYSDGTPMPVPRFTNKLRAWRGSNGVGHFIKATPSTGRGEWDRATFTLQTRTGRVLVVHRIFDADSKLVFEVEPPAPGTILAYSRPLPGLEERGTVEIRHVWLDLQAAQIWATTPPNRYKLNSCGLCYYRVADDGSLADYTPPGE